MKIKSHFESEQLDDFFSAYVGNLFYVFYFVRPVLKNFFGTIPIWESTKIIPNYKTNSTVVCITRIQYNIRRHW